MSYNPLHLSHDFGIDIYNMTINLGTKRHQANDLVDSGYLVELTIDGTINKSFDKQSAIMDSGEYMVVVTGRTIYQLRDWAVSNLYIHDNDKLVNLTISAVRVSADRNILISFTDGKHMIDKDAYLSVYNTYGLPENFTYDKFNILAVTMEL